MIHIIIRSKKLIKVREILTNEFEDYDDPALMRGLHIVNGIESLYRSTDSHHRLEEISRIKSLMFFMIYFEDLIDYMIVVYLTNLICIFFHILIQISRITPIHIRIIV